MKCMVLFPYSLDNNLTVQDHLPICNCSSLVLKVRMGDWSAVVDPYVLKPSIYGNDFLQPPVTGLNQE